MGDAFSKLRAVFVRPAWAKRRNAKHRRSWEQWGREDPYYGVLSLPQFRREHIADNLDTFFASGEALIADRLTKAEALYGPLPRDSALDFGCGVGRLLMPLARRFRKVKGVDVSKAMLAECRANLDRFGIANVSLAKDLGIGGGYDFVNSHLVLQHVPVAHGLNLLERMLSKTAVGGVASIQLTIDRGDNLTRALSYWLQRQIPGVHRLIGALRGRKITDAMVEMNEYPLQTILGLFVAHGFCELEQEFGREGRVLSVQLMARKG